MGVSHLGSAERSLGNQSENGGHAECRCYSNNSEQPDVRPNTQEVAGFNQINSSDICREYNNRSITKTMEDKTVSSGVILCWMPWFIRNVHSIYSGTPGFVDISIYRSPVKKLHFQRPHGVPSSPTTPPKPACPLDWHVGHLVLPMNP